MVDVIGERGREEREKGGGSGGWVMDDGDEQYSGMSKLCRYP